MVTFGASFSGTDINRDARPLNVGNSPWLTYHIVTDTDIGKITTQETLDGVNTGRLLVKLDNAYGIVVYPLSSIIVDDDEPTPEPPPEGSYPQTGKS